MKFLNIGCGSTTHPAWTNIDIVPSGSDVLVHNIRKGLPFEDDTFDAVYHSHVLEHIPRAEAGKFMKEAVRVLKPGGVMRVVAPDLEAIARLYIEKLEGVLENAKSADDYEWIMLELYDQVVRTASGGEMAKYLNRPDIPNKDFVISRIGIEAEKSCQPFRKPLYKRALGNLPYAFLFLTEKMRQKTAKALVFLIAGGKAAKSFDEGLFRNSGENHLWMYDRYSLRKLMEESGLDRIERLSAIESLIPSFLSHNLDTIKGKVRKPDSLFMEGVKPTSSFKLVEH